MRNIEIGGKSYKLEYTIEAGLYEDCAQSVIGFMTDIAEAETAEDIKKVLTATINVPKVCLTCFYAGLLENHEEEIKTIKDAKELLKVYFAENSDKETGNFHGLFMEILEVMGEDGFFKQLGLAQMFENTTEEMKKPQDHKKKATKKVSEK